METDYQTEHDALRRMLGADGQTVTGLAKQLGISRSTLTAGLAHIPLRPGTLALIRERLRREGELDG